MATTTTALLVEEGTGATLCERHLPDGLLAQVSTHPGHPLYHDADAVWWRLSDEDRRAFTEATGERFSCERCEA